MLDSGGTEGSSRRAGVTLQGAVLLDRIPDQKKVLVWIQKPGPRGVKKAALREGWPEWPLSRAGSPGQGESHFRLQAGDCVEKQPERPQEGR